MNARRIPRILAAGLALLLSFCATARADIVIAGISEVRGAAAVPGQHFRNGFHLAIDELNAAGGVLGQRLTLKQFDIDTQAEAAAAAAAQAAAARPFAIIGPVFSGMTASAMRSTIGTGIPHFTGGEAASLARQFHPTLLRTSLTQQGSMPRLVALAAHGLHARKVALLSVDNDYGRQGRKLLLDSLGRRGVRVVVDEAVAPGQKDMRGAAERMKAAAPDLAILYLNEGESIDALLALRHAGFDRPLVGEGPLLVPMVLEKAGAAAEGIFAHTGVSVETPQQRMQRFVASYKARFGTAPDHNAAKGYFAVQVIKVGLESLGRIDRKAFVELVKNQRLDGRRHPELMTTASYDLFGDLNRESYFMHVRGGRPQVLATLSSMDSPFVELPDGRSLPLNSDAFRAELRTLTARGAASRAQQR